MDLLVVGGSGFLGREVTRQAQRAGHRVVATFHSSRPLPVAEADWRALDIRCRGDVTALAADTRPDAIINAAYRRAGARQRPGLGVAGMGHRLCR